MPKENILHFQVQIQKAQKTSSFPNPFVGPDVILKLRSDPRTRGYLEDPEYLALLAQLQANPQLMGTKLNDPRVLTTLSVLMGFDAGQ